MMLRTRWNGSEALQCAARGANRRKHAPKCKPGGLTAFAPRRQSTRYVLPDAEGETARAERPAEQSAGSTDAGRGRGESRFPSRAPPHLSPIT